MKEIYIYSEYITLGQFLKLANLIYSGGQAKSYIFDNIILVNCEKEDRRGRKLRNSDIIEINGIKYQIISKNENK